MKRDREYELLRESLSIYTELTESIKKQLEKYDEYQYYLCLNLFNKQEFYTSTDLDTLTTYYEYLRDEARVPKPQHIFIYTSNPKAQPYIITKDGEKIPIYYKDDCVGVFTNMFVTTVKAK